MTSCFADKGIKCSALNIKDCKGCYFFKTKEKALKDREKAIKRLKRLGIYDEARKAYKEVK